MSRFIGLLRLNLGFRRLADWNPSVKSRRRKDQSTPGDPPSVQVSQKRAMAVPEINYQKLAEEIIKQQQKSGQLYATASLTVPPPQTEGNNRPEQTQQITARQQTIAP